jgi:hypothetical protein
MADVDAVSRVKIKLIKWAVFVVGLLVATSAGEVVAALVNQEAVSAGRLFGRGELLIACIGLLIAAMADLLFDPPPLVSPQILLQHRATLAFLVLLLIVVTIGYGATRIEMSVLTAEQASERGSFRAQLTGVMLLFSTASSAYGVYLSEKVGIDSA